jgi:hypothetical protein
MFKNGSDPSDSLECWLAEEAVAADLLQAIVDGNTDAPRETAREPASQTCAKRPSTRALFAYARRPHGAPADFAIEQALRTDPVISRRYRNLLAVMAQATSPVALAANTGDVPSRIVGNWRLRVSAPPGLPPVLVLEEQDPAPPPAAIEAVGSDGQAVRLQLPEPINHAIQVALDHDVSDLAKFHGLLANPDTEIFLLS